MLIDGIAENLRNGFIVDLGVLGKLYPAVNGRWDTDAENLSVADNIRYGTAIERRRISQRKPVEQLTMDGKHVAYYDGIIDASIATGAPRELIGKVCHGRKKSAGGYRWKFKE